MRQNLVIADLTVVGLLFGVYTGSLHMAGGMLIHQLSVLIVIANGMRLLRVPKPVKVETASQIAERVAAWKCPQELQRPAPMLAWVFVTGRFV